MSIDERIHVAIRSYRRAGRVTSLACFPFAFVWVPESQGEEYRRHYGDRVITIPDECDGNTSRKFNAILDRSPKKWTLILDDDITRLGMFEGGYRHAVGPEQLAEMIVHHFELAEALGVRLWGINVNHDPTGYRAFCPLNLLAPILGPFSGHLDPELRYDESVPAKEDYDFWLQNIRRYHKSLRVNKYHYMHDHGQKSGGFVSMRTAELERNCIQRLIEKWGSSVVKAGGMKGRRHSSGENILNTRVTVPIQGC
jgi:hypothetical protein